MLRPWAVGMALAVALMPLVVGAQPPAWEAWQTVAGVFDLGGPRTDGSLVVAGSAALYTLAPDGTPSPFARGSAGYHDDPATEAYLAVSPGLTATRLGCGFAADDTYVLRLHDPTGVTRVDAGGQQASPFVNVPAGAGLLNGITFDTTGAFGHSLLLTAAGGGRTEVLAVDCTGGVRVVTRSAPVVEGGLAVAPLGFGIYGGSLIAPDELSGVIWAIAPDGTASRVVASGLPVGPDIGVESLGFVPAGFAARGGNAYYSDRATPGNPHPGTDHVLRLASAELQAAGVQDGDLLAATEGGASMIAVHCDTSCRVVTVVGSPTTAHGEGHIVFTLNPLPTPSPVPTPARSPRPTPAAASTQFGLTPRLAVLAATVVVVVVAVAVALALVAPALIRRRR